MNKKIFFYLVLIIVSLISVPLFAGVSVDLGISALGNAVYSATRPAGATAAIGFTLFESKALIQATGGFFVPALNADSEDPVISISAGVLYSPFDYLYLGLRSGTMSPPDATDGWISYGTMVIRVQKPGKGLHYFAETEIGFLGLLSRFTMGINFTL